MSERTSQVQLSVEGAIASLRFANPPRHTLTADMVREMHGALDALPSHAGVRVLVLRSATKEAFITHYEVGELASIAEQRGRTAREPAPDAAPELHPLHTLILRLEALPLVTVAAIDGLAMGGGLELALGCDFRLVREGRALLGLPETSVGIIPGAGGTQRLALLLGVAKALDLILHGALLSPRDALAAGIVHRVYEAERFDAELAAFVANLAQRAPIALREAKRAIRQGVEQPLRDGLLVEQQAFERAMASEDARSAMRAFLAGERYSFVGK